MDFGYDDAKYTDLVKKSLKFSTVQSTKSSSEQFNLEEIVYTYSVSSGTI